MAGIGNTRPRSARASLPTGPRQAGSVDFATLIGVLGGFAMIGLAMFLGGSAGSFVNAPGILIVLGGTFLVTTASFTLEEVARAQGVMLRAVVYHAERPDRAALQVLDMAEQSRRKGVLTLQGRFPALARNPFLYRAMGLVVEDRLGVTMTEIIKTDRS
jgi:chemotaxis protein MotA